MNESGRRGLWSGALRRASLWCRRLVRAAGAVLLLGAAAQVQAQRPPQLDLTLRPVASQGRLSEVAVRMRIEAPAAAPDRPLLRMPLTIVSIPTAAYDAASISARDEAGPLPLVSREEEPRPEGVYRQYLPTRPTQGDVVVQYVARPRQVSENTNNGPLFDMRAEGAGFTAAGISFLALPAGEAPYRVSLDWDLDALPEGSTGVWSFGEGDVELIAPPQQLAFTFYAAGPLRRFAGEGEGRFQLYWLNDAPFSIEELARRIGVLYETMSTFFGERDSSYRVFARQHPYRGMGGTALPQSFTFGYHPPSRPSVDDLQELLAHEMAHNWPKMQGEHGETAWYSEGAAEYYSLVLAHRAGLLSTEGFLREINQRAHRYYTHPFRSLTNAEAAQRFWSDPFVQQVPYGRGFLYLAQTDGAIRAATGARESLDDVVRELRAHQQAGESYGIDDWLRLVGNRIGPERARAGFQRMTSGAAVVPGTAFGQCFVAVPDPQRRLELGFARRSFVDEPVVRNLVPGSNAARAGVREGDEIVEYTDLKKLASPGAPEMEIRVRRDGEIRRFSYLPRAEAVEAWRWELHPAADPAACGF